MWTYRDGGSSVSRSSDSSPSSLSGGLGIDPNRPLCPEPSIELAGHTSEGVLHSVSSGRRPPNSARSGRGGVPIETLIPDGIGPWRPSLQGSGAGVPWPLSFGPSLYWRPKGSKRFILLCVTVGSPFGPKLHGRPYAEVFVVETGQATFQIGEEGIEAWRVASISDLQDASDRSRVTPWT